MLRANRARARQACLLYALSFLAAASLCVVDAGLYFFPAGQAASFASGLSSSRSGLLLVRVTLSLGTFIWLVRWLWRAYANLHQLPGIRPGYPSSWALWAWFIPVSALIRPYSIVREVWQYTQQAAWGQVRQRPAIVGWWWAAYLSSGVLSWVVLARTAAFPNERLPGEIIQTTLDAVVIVLIWCIIRRASTFEEALAARAATDAPDHRLAR